MIKHLTIFLLVPVILFSCQAKDNSSEEQQKAGKSDILVMATLYNRLAAEYRAIAYQAYNIAGERLVSLAKSGIETANKAVIVDIDETLLDNSPYQVYLAAENKSYPERWNDWCNLAEADPVPGAVRFLQLADSLGFAIFYISNRKQQQVADSTLSNLKKLGFPQLFMDHLLFRLPESDINQDPSSKVLRRNEIVSKGYEIVLLAGDNLGDFFEDSKDPAIRQSRVDSMENMFGDRFIVLPNAMYGSWVNTLGLSYGSVTDSLVKSLAPQFN